MPLLKWNVAYELIDHTYSYATKKKRLVDEVLLKLMTAWKETCKALPTSKPHQVTVWQPML